MDREEERVTRDGVSEVGSGPRRDDKTVWTV